MARTIGRLLRTLLTAVPRRPLCAILLALASLAVTGMALAAPKVVVISLDGATPRFVEHYLDSGALSAQEGLGLLKRRGLTARQNVTLRRAIDHLGASLRGRLWDDDAQLDRQGRKVFDEEKDAVEELLRIDARPSAVTDVIEGIVTVAQELAAIVIDEAAGADGNGWRMTGARRAFLRAQGEAARGQFERAIEYYAWAWELARGAIRSHHGRRDEHDD